LLIRMTQILLYPTMKAMFQAKVKANLKRIIGKKQKEMANAFVALQKNLLYKKNVRFNLTNPNKKGGEGILKRKRRDNVNVTNKKTKITEKVRIRRRIRRRTRKKMKLNMMESTTCSMKRRTHRLLTW